MTGQARRWALLLLCWAIPVGAAERPRLDVRPDLAARIAPEVRYQRPAVDADDDGYVPLRLAAELLRDPGLSAGLAACDATSSPPPLEVEAVAANGLSLWLFDQALARPAFQWPPFQVGEESFHRYRQTFHLLIAQTRIDHSAGRAQRAGERLAAALALARRANSGDAQLIHALVGLYLERRLIDEMLCLAARQSTDADLLRLLATAVAAGPAPCQAYAQTLRAELGSSWLPTMQDLEASRQWHGPPLAEAAQLAGEVLAAHLADCGTNASLPCAAPPEGIEFNPNAYDEAFWRAGAQRVAAETLLAVRLYRLRMGHRPVSLDDLVQSGEMTSAPRDPFTAAPFVYEAASGDLSVEMPAALRDCRRRLPPSGGPLIWSVGDP